MSQTDVLMILIFFGAIGLGFLFGMRWSGRPYDELAQAAREASDGADWWFQQYVESRQEIMRLKGGNFSEEEFQGLCHNFSADDAERFRRGCVEYQRKLFGEKGNTDQCPMTPE